MLNARGIPKTGLLSISAGGTRRQVQLSAIDQPLRFPVKSADEISAVKVDVLDILGRARMPYESKENRVTVSLDNGDAADGLDGLERMELDLIMRPCADPSSPSSNDAARDPGLRHRKELEHSSYLEEHGLVNFMQFLLHSLMQDKPVDPYPFLQKQVAMRMASKGSSSGGYTPATTGGFNNSLNFTAASIAEASEVDTLLQRLSPRAASSAPPEEIMSLEKEALDACQRSRAENQKLREMASQLQSEYEKVMQESRNLHHKVDAKRAAKAEEKARAREQEARAVADEASKKLNEQKGSNGAYKEIERLQEEIAQLARENAKLVADLARGRDMINLIRGDMEEMRRDFGVTSP